MAKIAASLPAMKLPVFTPAAVAEEGVCVRGAGSRR
jgi:hypothetical protein